MLEKGGVFVSDAANLTNIITNSTLAYPVDAFICHFVAVIYLF